MRKRVAAGDGGLEVIVQIMHVHRTAAEASTGRDVEVAYHLVDAEAAFDPAALLALGVEFLGIVHPFALLHVLPTAKSP